MDILFDFQAFTLQKYGGVSRVFTELISRVMKSEHNALVPIRYSQNEYIKYYLSVNDMLQDKNLKGKNFVYRNINKMCFSRGVKGCTYDIYHPTYYDTFFVEEAKKKGIPIVVTVHDMIYEIFPDRTSIFDSTMRYKERMISEADKVIAISENTKKDLMKFYGIAEEKIEVIYWGISKEVAQDDDFDEIAEKYGKYLLFVGSRVGYKNFKRFFQAYKNISKDKELNLVCVGGGHFLKDEQQMIAECGLTDRIFQLSVDDNTLDALYRYAKCLVYPSTYEGFGLPILEAFRNGCPVVLSDASSFPEVAADAGMYFQPYNIQSIQEAIEKVIYDEEMTSRLVEKGYKRIDAFSWQKTLDKTLQVYESLLARR